jgi:hypothetical protein
MVSRRIECVDQYARLKWRCQPALGWYFPQSGSRQPVVPALCKGKSRATTVKCQGRETIIMLAL